MKRISIDCSKISSLNDFHRVFSEVSEVPDYYGKNLDALWDVLTVDILGPVEFTFNSHSFFKSTNEDAFNKVIKVFNEAKQERGNDFIIVLK
ncbi:MAG: barstar family protein [Bdellovibrionaceae bacterium]|nr:barstar family protein [Pseudobdellovibrionaceae bacterium]